MVTSIPVWQDKSTPAGSKPIMNKVYKINKVNVFNGLQRGDMIGTGIAPDEGSTAETVTIIDSGKDRKCRNENP